MFVRYKEIAEANVHSVAVVPKSLTNEETEVFGDSAYLDADKRGALLPAANTKKLSDIRSIADPLKARTVRFVLKAGSGTENTRSR